MSSNILRLLFVFMMRLTLQYRLTTNKHKRWDPIICCCGHIYTVQDLNSLDAYILHIGFSDGEAREEILHTCYTARNVIHAYIARVLLMSISQNFSSDSHERVKF